MPTKAPPAAAAETNQPLPPQNLDAEESILGAMMLSPRAIDAVAQLVDAADFYRASHAHIYRAALALHQLGQPVDAITVADRLDELDQLEDVGGKERLHEIASLVPASSNAAHYAKIVVEMAQLRALAVTGEQIQRLAWDRDAPTPQLLEQARELLAGLDARTGAATVLAGGHTHAEVLDLQLPTDRYLIDDLIPAGAVGTIAAVPEAHKSWLAQAIAIRVARGNGYVLGKPITHQGNVGYLWQDDSTAEEAERIKAFEEVHPTDPQGDTPVDWYLNTGIQLPRDISRLRATVETKNYALLILDSYYNFLPGIDLKDEQAEQIVALLKREISDPTGCTVLIVDHMPWATEQNRGRLRAYGGVFKNAATRFGIYIDVVGDKLHIEARGNNIRGIPKRLAYWDADQLELRLLNTDEIDRDDLITARMQDVLAWLQEHDGGHTGKAVRDALGTRAPLTDEALDALLAEDRIHDHGTGGQPWTGKRGAPRYWAYGPNTNLVAETPSLFNEGNEVSGNASDRAIATSLHDKTRYNEVPAHDDLVGLSTTSKRGDAQTEQESQTTSLRPSNEVQAEDPPGTQDEPRCTPTEGGYVVPPSGRNEVSAPPPDQPRSEPEQWMRSEGFMHDNPAEALIDRYPMTAVAEIERLIELAAALQTDGRATPEKKGSP